MKILICGSREINSYKLVEQAVAESGFVVTSIISGGARGVDRRAKIYALTNRIPFEEFPADWGTHGRAAGPIRNARMVDLADAVIAIWDGRSPGTRHSIGYAKSLGKPVHVKIVP